MSENTVEIVLVFISSLCPGLICAAYLKKLLNSDVYHDRKYYLSVFGITSGAIISGFVIYKIIRVMYNMMTTYTESTGAGSTGLTTVAAILIIWFVIWKLK
ncbi:hypothetical protein GKC33_01450 [Lactobacillus salivarius]|uniref:Uncharacterized protein n=1 Tax=Ligilactobacillus salivarius TaxID=1624 RepID=A0A6A8LLZ3_9LACO|nr:hypothetical protein [Ligilactobacillus salivarius]MSE07426.1 hypothetical protein [Ligilactobacillus salivarius]